MEGLLQLLLDADNQAVVEEKLRALQAQITAMDPQLQRVAAGMQIQLNDLSSIVNHNADALEAVNSHLSTAMLVAGVGIVAMWLWVAWSSWRTERRLRHVEGWLKALADSDLSVLQVTHQDRTILSLTLDQLRHIAKYHGKPTELPALSNQSP
jgi:hypothetical protein